MACNCIEGANKLLADHNTKMVQHLVIERQDGGISGLRSTIALGVEKIEPRGKRPTMMIATYCPLCGVRYVPEPTGADA
ncbi:conserved protein of unknown function [Methylorubrum extorquens]|uniref:Uncharacterized protein n=1 Tax=Methylorubrum extorquens TaxID=408 RepID=A0A2N9ARL8_METEX|nr:conserved protein of unknown function [Methylorubrum extorquens]